MNRVAKFSPRDFVIRLWDLRVPGYLGFAGGQVSISTYLSANAAFGGNSKAGVLHSALLRIVKGKPEMALAEQPGFPQVFTGQGSIENFITAMSIINRYQDDFKADRTIAKYFTSPDFLQAMVDDACFGLDCIGFIGTYLVDAEVLPAYQPRRPLDYTALFAPVKSLDEITDLAVVMLTNGMHIQIIDTVTERNPAFIKVDLCQSSSGGPQCNSGVTIRSGGGNYLPVDEFRQALASKQYADKHAADNEQRQKQGLAPRDYEAFLRALLTKPNTQFGFCGGAIFQLNTGGEPKNPVGGSVYVGVATNSLRVGTP